MEDKTKLEVGTKLEIGTKLEVGTYLYLHLCEHHVYTFLHHVYNYVCTKK